MGQLSTHTWFQVEMKLWVKIFANLSSKSLISGNAPKCTTIAVVRAWTYTYGIIILVASHRLCACADTGLLAEVRFVLLWVAASNVVSLKVTCEWKREKTIGLVS